MAVNLNKPQLWKDDIARSVDLYNTWFLEFAPKTFRDQRKSAATVVAEAFRQSNNLSAVSSEMIAENPSLLPILRMACCPPIARERLSGLSYVPKTLIDSMDKRRRVPPKLKKELLDAYLAKIVGVIDRLIDPDIIVWRGRKEAASERELERALTIVADRLCGANADPIIRNAQESRQLEKIKVWLEARGYQFVAAGGGITHEQLVPGQFAFRLNIPVSLSVAETGDADEDEEDLPSTLAKQPKAEPTGVNIPVDVAVMPKNAKQGDLPMFIEAKSAGDFTNVNKRRKEEAKKTQQLQATYGEDMKYILFLCGYFNSGYLGYEAADGIDWVWEHRIDDLEQFGL